MNLKNIASTVIVISLIVGGLFIGVPRGLLYWHEVEEQGILKSSKGTKIFLSSESELLNSGMSTIITTTVEDQNGKPIKNEKVNFKIDKNSTGAILSLSQSQTDNEGKITISYTAGKKARGADTIIASVGATSEAIKICVSPLVGLVSAQAQWFPEDIPENNFIQEINTFVSLSLINVDDEEISNIKFTFATVSYIKCNAPVPDKNLCQIPLDLGTLNSYGKPYYISMWLNSEKMMWLDLKQIHNNEDLTDKIKERMEILFNPGNPNSGVFYSIYEEKGKELETEYLIKN